MAKRYKITAYNLCRRGGKLGTYARASAFAETLQEAAKVCRQFKNEHPDCTVEITPQPKDERRQQ